MNNDYSPPKGLSESHDDIPPADRSRGWLYLITIGTLMLMGLLFLAWLGNSRRDSWVGKPLPPVDLQPLIGAEKSLSREDLAGQITVLHFWGTWCPPCQLEFPEFAAAFAPLHGHPNLIVASISCSSGPEYDLSSLREETEAFLRGFDAPFPTYSDPTAFTRQQLALIAPSGSFGYPTTIIVGPDLRIKEAAVGYREGHMEELARNVQRWLREL
ncbi:MAG: hypothetical protein KatS3mg111_2880 [Pirellulaceae bacterium]|nr:MAG: hypothetical protein KatS3mg111_2880 [Pirellulaceae bacterium]